ncbi:MAG: glycosyltransferase [Proteobacteria bacterium]|nr:glycosyltransferase [Pseudomonadota bacterium]
MYFSICIPQFNRTDFLLVSLQSFLCQHFQDFEICISDGASTDGGLPRLHSFLRRSGLRYALAESDRNLQYDENLRKSISLSRGRYVLLMGNDDSLSDAGVLAYLKDVLESNSPVSVAIPNYHELSTGVDFNRMRMTGVIGEGPDAVASTFRHFSFISGIILDGESARAAATSYCDGSEMYQMYLGARLVAAGGRFLAIERICVNKDIQIPGQDVDSYRAKARLFPNQIIDRPLPMGRILETVAYGIDSAKPRPERNRAVSRVALQLYLFTYPFWIFEYRRVQSFNYALGVYFSLRPSVTTRNIRIPLCGYLVSWTIYLLLGLIGFATPIRLFDKFRPMLYALAKRA